MPGAHLDGGALLTPVALSASVGQKLAEPHFVYNEEIWHEHTEETLPVGYEIPLPGSRDAQKWPYNVKLRRNWRTVDFNSNVQPKRVVKPAREPWKCLLCGTNNLKFLVRCADCGAHRDRTF
jgi:hypothetical protein